MSALAQYYLAKGYEVSGSDLASSEITDFLKERGVKIAIGNYPDYIKKNFNLVIYSPAVPNNNPELLKAKDCKIKTLSYPEALGELTKQYFTIAVAGAHGKSTTTAMIGLILARAGLGPTVIVGTKLKEFGGSNFRAGKSGFLVIEACEYDGSFLHYLPKIIALTNVDKEHLDYFKNFRNVIKTFKDFILKLPSDGFLAVNKDDPKLNPKSKILNSKQIQNLKFKIVDYSLKQPEAEKLKKILKIPGQHNISNALAALAVARILNVPDKIAFKALSRYKGSWRRFELFEKKIINPKKSKAVSYTLISDYGHHPNEILATLKSAREKYPQKKIWCIFQPHQYQRTYYLFNDFIKVFREVPVDSIIITDIYDVAGREEKKISSSVNSENLAKKIKRGHIKYLPVNDAEKFVKDNIGDGDVLIIMGAGDIYKLCERF